MVINVTMREALYVAELVSADAKTKVGSTEDKLALLKKINATIDYQRAKEKKAKATD